MLNNNYLLIKKNSAVQFSLHIKLTHGNYFYFFRLCINNRINGQGSATKALEVNEEKKINVKRKSHNIKEQRESCKRSITLKCGGKEKKEERGNQN